VGQECGEGPVFPAGNLIDTTLVRTQRLQSPTPKNDDYFGDELAISGNYALATASFYDEEKEEGTDFLYFLERRDGEWQRVQTIERTGESYIDEIAIAGEYAFYSDWYYATPNDENRRSGRVYVYRRNSSGRWEEVQVLEGNDDSIGPIDEEFGRYLQVTEDYLAVHYGRPNSSSEIPKSIVRIFELQDNEWTYHSTFQGVDTTYSKVVFDFSDENNFAFAGTRIVADMQWGERAYGGEFETGRVAFDFNEQSGEWEDTFVFPEGDYRAEPPNNYTFYEDDLVLQGDVAVFSTTQWTPDGDRTYSATTGQAFIYQRNNDRTWTKTGELGGDGQYPLSGFAISDNYFVASGGTADEYVDALYVFQHDGNGQFTQIDTIREGEETEFTYEGFGDFGLSGNTLVTGYWIGYDDDDDSYELPGTIFFYDLAPTYTLPAASLAACAAPAYRPEVTSDCEVTLTADTVLTDPGTYDLTWTALDEAGNRAIATQQLTVTGQEVSLPLREDFTTAPPCWTADPAWNIFEGAFRLLPTDGQTDENSLSLPTLDLETGITYAISFRYRSLNPNGGGQLRLMTGDDAKLFDDTEAPAAYQYVELLYEPTEDGSTVLSFGSPRDAMDEGLLLDDVRVMVFAPPTTDGAAALAGNSDNACTRVRAQGVNGSAWIRVLDDNGKLLAEINPNGNALGDVVVSMTDYADAPTAPFTGDPQLGRYYGINPDNGSGPYTENGGVKIRLYVTDAELDQLSNAVGETLDWEDDLIVTHFSGPNADCDLLNSSGDFTTEDVTTTGDYGGTAHYVEFMTDDFSEFGITYQEAVSVTPGWARSFAGLEAFPNPVADRLTVRLHTELAGRIQLQLTDIFGRTVQQRYFDAVVGANRVELDLTSVPSGTYLVTVTDGERMGTLRVVKRGR
jgi:hypothetical protein